MSRAGGRKPPRWERPSADLLSELGGNEPRGTAGLPAAEQAPPRWPDPQQPAPQQLDTQQPSPQQLDPQQSGSQRPDPQQSGPRQPSSQQFDPQQPGQLPGPRAGLPAPELDVIRVERLHVRAFHGVHEHERRDGQDFYIDAETWLDARAAATSDNIGDTLHYGHLMRALADAAAGEPVDLIETLAERLAAAVLTFPEPRAVRITVHKPQAPVPLRFSDVAVSILRFRPDEGPAS